MKSAGSPHTLSNHHYCSLPALCSWTIQSYSVVVFLLVIFVKYHGTCTTEGCRRRQTQEYHLGLPTKLTFALSVCGKCYTPVPALALVLPQDQISGSSLGGEKVDANLTKLPKNLTVELKATQALCTSLKCRANKMNHCSTVPSLLNVPSSVRMCLSLSTGVHFHSLLFVILYGFSGLLSTHSS